MVRLGINSLKGNVVRVLLVTILCVSIGIQHVSAELYVPPIPAPPTLPPAPTPQPPGLPPVPPVAPPTVPPFPVLPPTLPPSPTPQPPTLPPSPTPQPPGLPLPPVLPSPPPLPSPTPSPTPSPVPAAQAFIAVYTDGYVTPITSGIRQIAADAEVTEVSWFSAHASACETDGFTTTNAITGSLVSPDPQLALAPGASHTYALRCKNTAGVWSAWREVTIIKASQPPAPANSAPEAPVIRGADMSTAPALTAPVDFVMPFSFRAVDADGDAVKYHIDWDQNGTTDQFAPTSGFTPSGAVETTTYAWSVTGTYTFAVRAEDSTGRLSPWTTHTITIVNPVAVPPAAPSVSLMLSKNFVRAGDFVTATLSVSADYEVTCMLYGVSGGTYTISYPGGVGTQTYTRTTAPLLATQIVRAVCSPVTPGFVLADEVREARVGVVPAIEEI